MTIVDSLSSLGKIWTLIGAIFATIIGIGLIATGLYLKYRKPDRDLVRGSIARINNDENGICTGQQFYKCTLSIQYVYNGQNYMSNFDYSGNTDYVIGQTVQIYVLKTDPYSITMQPPLPVSMMYLFIVLGFVTALGGWFWYWASRKWKAVAVAEGAGGLFQIVSRQNLL